MKKKHRKLVGEVMPGIKNGAQRIGWCLGPGKVSRIHCIQRNGFILCGERHTDYGIYLGKVATRVNGKSNYCPKCLDFLGSSSVFKSLPWAIQITDKMIGPGR